MYAVIVLALSKVTLLSGRTKLAFCQMDVRGGGLTSNLSIVDEPVAYLPTARVEVGNDHGNRVVPIQGHARVGRCQRKVRSASNICRILQSRTMGSILKILTGFFDELTRSNASKTLEVGIENCYWLESWDGDRDELCIVEIGFDSFQPELYGLSESDRE